MACRWVSAVVVLTSLDTEWHHLPGCTRRSRPRPRMPRREPRQVGARIRNVRIRRQHCALQQAVSSDRTTVRNSQPEQGLWFSPAPERSRWIAMRAMLRVSSMPECRRPSKVIPAPASIFLTLQERTPWNSA